MERRTIVQDDCAASGEGRDKPVPHHPRRGREVEHAVSGPDIAVQDVFLLVLDECPGCRVDYAFRGTGCSRRVKNVEWMRGWQLCECEW